MHLSTCICNVVFQCFRTTHKTEVELLARYKVPSFIANNTADDDKPTLETIDTNDTPPPPLFDVCSRMEEELKQFAASYCVVCEQKFCVVHLQVMQNMDFLAHIDT